MQDEFADDGCVLLELQGCQTAPMRFYTWDATWGHITFHIGMPLAMRFEIMPNGWAHATAIFRSCVAEMAEVGMTCVPMWIHPHVFQAMLQSTQLRCALPNDQLEAWQTVLRTQMGELNKQVAKVLAALDRQDPERN